MDLSTTRHNVKQLLQHLRTGARNSQRSFFLFFLCLSKSRNSANRPQNVSIKEFRKQRDRAIAGEIELPYQFQYVDRQFFRF